MVDEIYSYQRLENGAGPLNFVKKSIKDQLAFDDLEDTEDVVFGVSTFLLVDFVDFTAAFLVDTIDKEGFLAIIFFSEVTPIFLLKEALGEIF